MTSNPVMKKLGRRLRLGVIGGGPGSFIGSVHRGAAVLEEMYEVVAGVLSSDPDRSLSAAKELGIARAYSSAEQMFAAEADRADGMDLVAIMTPNNSHYTLACQALEAGFHVMCEKPLTNDLDEAQDLVKRVQASGRQFCVAYGYTGYPMVRQARAMIEAGELGEIRMIQCEYVQGHLAELTASEQRGQNWHMDPAVVGPSLILGDIATHSYHLASYVSGMEPAQINADVTTVVPGREAHDYAGIQLRYANGARGMLWITQAAAGATHGLYLRIFGSKGGLEWHQEQPNELLYRRLNAPATTYTKGGPGLSEAANRVTRIAIGHPEGYREAFANLYSDLAEAIVATETASAPEPLSLWYPNEQDGASGVRFVQAALRSSENGGSWEPCGPDLQARMPLPDHR